MITRSLHHLHTSSATTEELPAVRLPITGKQVAVRQPPDPFMRLVYHKLPADLEDASHLHEEIRQAVEDYMEILHTYPAVVYLSETRLSQMVHSGFAAYFVRSGQGFRAIPFRSGALPDGIIVCASG